MGEHTRRHVPLKERRIAARIRLKIDRSLGLETPDWIRELALREEVPSHNATSTNKNKTEITFDQGWTLIVTRHEHGASLEWERSGSWDAHLTDLLSHEISDLIEALEERD